MNDYTIFLIVYAILGIAYTAYAIVDRYFQYKERISLYGKEEKDKEE